MEEGEKRSVREVNEGEDEGEGGMKRRWSKEGERRRYMEADWVSSVVLGGRVERRGLQRLSKGEGWEGVPPPKCEGRRI